MWNHAVMSGRVTPSPARPLKTTSYALERRLRCARRMAIPDAAAMLALHTLFCLTGAALLRRATILAPSRLLIACGAYPLGLVANVIVAFTLNQFAHLPITSATLLAQAAGVVVLSRWRREKPPLSPRLPCHIGPRALAWLVIAVGILAAKHG